MSQNQEHALVDLIKAVASSRNPRGQKARRRSGTPRSYNGPTQRRSRARSTAVGARTNSNYDTNAAQRMLSGNAVSSFQSSADGVRGLFRGSIVITNSATAGTANYNVSLDFASAGLGNISTWLGQLGAMYRKFKINAVAIKIVPITATTGGGYVAVGYEAAASVGNPGSLAGVTDHVVHAVVPTGQVDYLYITAPMLPAERRLTTPGSSADDRDGSSFGTIQVWGNNSGAAAAGIALLDFALDITFAGMS